MKKLNMRGWLVVYLVLAMGLVGIMKLGNQPTLEENVEWITVRAHAGDTLWEMIAERNGDVHIGDLVYKAEHADGNEVHWQYGQFVLQAGQEVRIPVVQE